MVIKVSCPNCFREFRLSDDKAGRKFRCKECSNAVAVPSQEEDDWDDFGSLADDYGDEEDEYDQPYRPPRSSSRKKKRSKKDAPIADLGKRFLGAIIDGFVYFIAYSLPIFLFGMFAAINDIDIDSNMPMLVALVVLGLGSAFGLQVFLLATRSQTIGKIVVNTCIYDYDSGRPATWGKTVGVRLILNQLISFLPFYGLVDILFILSDEHRCLHDRLANTYVVDLS